MLLVFSGSTPHISGKPQLAGTATRRTRRRCDMWRWPPFYFRVYPTMGSENWGFHIDFTTFHGLNMIEPKNRYGFLPSIATFPPSTCKSSAIGHETCHSRCAATNLRARTIQPRDWSSTVRSWRWNSQFPAWCWEIHQDLP